MAGEIGKASIEIVADLSKFPPELKAKLKAAFAEGVKGVDMHALSDTAEREGEKAAKASAKGFEHSAKSEFDRVGKSAGRGLLSSISGIFRRDGSKSGGGGLTGFIKDIFSSAQDAIGKGIQGLQAAGSGIGSALGGLSGGGDITSLIKTSAIILAIPAVFALAGALVHLTGILLALPAAVGVVAAAIIPMVIAFQGVGEAIGAGFSGDVGKFNAALKGLAPSARAVVREFVAFKRPLEDLKRSVQQNFFAPLVGQIKPLLTTLLPVLNRGLSTVASSLGRVFSGLVGTLRSAGVTTALQNLFASTARIVATVGPALVRLFGTFFAVLNRGLPFAERLFTSLGNQIDRFSGFLQGVTKSGKFDTFLNNAINIGKDLFGLLGSLGSLIKSIFGGQDVEQSSEGFIKNITKAVDKLTEFFNSASGRRTINDLIITVKGLGIVLIGLAIAFGTVIRWTFDFIDAVKGAARAVGDFFSAVGSAISTGAGAIGGFFASIGSAIATFFTQDIPAAFDAVVGFFESLPGTILGLLQGLVDAVTFQVGQFIGLFLAAPFLIGQALDKIPGLVFGAVEAIGSFLSTLPGVAFSALASFASIVGGAISSGIQAGVNFVRSGVEQIASFIGSIPGRVAAVGPALLNAARSLGRKIGDGLSEIGNFASNIGSKIVGAVKSGINHIIDGINSGIASIDDKIPISLPRLPHLERGGVVDSPTVALIGEKGKREVVLPLTDPKRTRELAQQSGLSKILGSGGAAPTVNLTAILDGMGLIKVIDMRVDAALGDQGAELAFGART